MGVDFYTCQNEGCGYNFPDCGDYWVCPTCESRFHSAKCGGREYIEDENGNRTDTDFGDDANCILCRKESIPHYDMVQFLLTKLNLTYDQATELYRNEK